MAEENLTLNKVLKKLSKVAGFKDLSPNQIMTKLASSKQSSVMNAVRAAKFTGGLATIAGGLLRRHSKSCCERSILCSSEGSNASCR